MPNLMVFLLGVIALAAFFRFDFIFYVVYIFFFVYLLSRAWIDAVLKRIVCERTYEGRALNGEKVPVTLTVTNRSWLPIPYLRVHESVPARLKTPNFERAVLSMSPRSSATMHYELDCRHRGLYLLGPMTIEAGDLFGIYSEERQVIHKHNIAVYPRIVSLTDLSLPAQTPYGTIRRKQSLMEDPSRLLGVRPYMDGDSLRHIHWKMTASSGQLQTKRFEPAISVEAQIYLNLNRADYSVQRLATASELAIETAASFAAVLTQQRQTVGISSNGSDPLVDEDSAINLRPNRGAAQLTAILDVLARIELNEQVPFEVILREARLQLRWGGTGVVVTPHATDELVSILLLLKRSGLNIILILVDPQASFAAIKRRMEQAGIETFEVWQESDLNVWR
ncbi:MAG: DUF58 domain-containing protein [Chloroflexi bacterium]|nr:DUF58 domain-containing protein [Chloroflexota bacterium]